MRERAVVVSFACAMLVASACGGKHARTVTDFDSVTVGDLVRVEGTLSLRGSAPFTMLAIETEGGVVINIESRSATLQQELKSLDGLRCAVEGEVLTRIDPNIPLMDATRYDVLALPTGETPIIGVLSVEDGECLLTTKAGVRYWILGDLAAALRDYAGARVWIAGIETDTDAKNRPRKSTPLTPSGYGVIDEAPAR